MHFLTIVFTYKTDINIYIYEVITSVKNNFNIFLVGMFLRDPSDQRENYLFRISNSCLCATVDWTTTTWSESFIHSSVCLRLVDWFGKSLINRWEWEVLHNNNNVNHIWEGPHVCLTTKHKQVGRQARACLHTRPFYHTHTHTHLWGGDRMIESSCQNFVFPYTKNFGNFERLTSLSIKIFELWHNSSVSFSLRKVTLNQQVKN